MPRMNDCCQSACTRRLGSRRQSAARVLGAGLALAAALLAPGSVRAQSGAEWLYRTAFEVQSIDPACLAEGRARSVHILGVAGMDAAQLSEAERGRIAADLTDILASRLKLRVTKADTLGEIAGASDAAGAEDLAALVRATSRSDVTLLVTPLQRTGTQLQAEIRVWTRDAEGLTCAPSFRVAIPLQAADPACARSYEMARGSGDLQRLEAFAEFFPHCPEAVSARTAAREMREAQDAERLSASCEAAFQAAHAAKTSEALDGFLARGTGCAQYQAALLLQQTLRAQELCAEAYAEANLAHTEDGYAAFIRAHAACGEVAAATAQLGALRAAAGSATRPTTPAAPAPAPVVRDVAPARRPDPSFDCARASIAAEHAICASVRLADLDRQLGDVYGGVRARLSRAAFDRVRAEQRGWISQRDGCGADAACLERRYAERIARLRGY